MAHLPLDPTLCVSIIRLPATGRRTRAETVVIPVTGDLIRFQRRNDALDLIRRERLALVDEPTRLRLRSNLPPDSS